MAAITVYLVEKIGIGKAQYYCVTPVNGMSSSTENPKRAMRFFTEEGAKATAHALGWGWHATPYEFDGNEPAFVAKALVN
jgi:hypothetical protein